jgi:ferredoxin
MPRLTIDNRIVEVPHGATLLDAARKLGIDVPTMCYRDGLPPANTCMVCLMKVDGHPSYLPSCSTHAADGMVVESEAHEVRDARRAALELLLSDHTGDCIAPCQMADPRHVNIPVMIRQIAAGDLRAAAVTLAAGGPVPAPGQIDAHRPERACRRRRHDEAVAIGLLERYVAAAAAEMPDLPPGKPARMAMSVHVGRLREGEMEAFLRGASGAPRVSCSRGEAAGFTDNEARAEAARCLHCDCRKSGACKLREYAERYGASPSRYRSDRRPFVQDSAHESVIYESGKCISCGICVRICERAGEELGLTYIGRGFNVRIGVPFTEDLSAALRKTAERCVEACPTGALAFKDEARNRYDP